MSTSRWSRQAIREAGRQALLAASGAGMRRVRAGGTPDLFNAPWQLAMVDGSFAQAGLLLDWSDYRSDGNLVLQALRTDKLDIAVLSTECAMLELQRNNDFDLLAPVSRMGQTWGVFEQAKKINPLESEKSLRSNHKYAICRPGSGGLIRLERLLMQNNAPGGYAAPLHTPAATFRTVQNGPRVFLTGGPEQAFLAAQEAAADVVICEMSDAALVPEIDTWRCLGSEEYGWPQFVIVAAKRLVDEGEEQVIAMLKALQKSAAQLKKDKELAVSTLSLMYGIEAGQVSSWLTSFGWDFKPDFDAKSMKQALLYSEECTLLNRWKDQSRGTVSGRSSPEDFLSSVSNCVPTRMRSS